jgi:hypothetical protein
MAKLNFGPKRFTKVKRLARSGWRGGVKPALKKTGKLAKKGLKTVGKAAYDHPGIVNKGIEFASGEVGSRVGQAVAVGTENPVAGFVAGAATTAALAKGGIYAKDKLLNKHFGTQHNAGSSHSGKNYAVKRKAAVRYNVPSSSPVDHSERLIKTSSIPPPSSHAAALRNTSHLRSAAHPTGGKI